MNENITPLPWCAEQTRVGTGLDVAIYNETGDLVAWAYTMATATTIVAAMNAYPALTARVKELEEALRETLAAMEMQEGRELGEFHIPQASAKAAWDESKTIGWAALNKEPTT